MRDTVVSVAKKLFCMGGEMKKVRLVKSPAKRIKDLPEDSTLENVHFRAPDGTTGHWVSQWGYEGGRAGYSTKRI
jgi:hypothetical protein